MKRWLPLLLLAGAFPALNLLENLQAAEAAANPADLIIHHAKVVTVATADGRRYSLVGSANLRTNSNREQFCLTDDAALHDWHAGWIDAMVSQHEGDEGHHPGPG